MMKLKKIPVSDTARKFFVESKHRTLNFFLFTAALAVISRLLMYCAFIVVKGNGAEFIPSISVIWDNNWYSSILEYGYFDEPMWHDSHDAANWAFFPLDIVLIKILSIGGRFDYRLVGFILNTFLTVLAITVAYKYIMMDSGKLKTAIIFTFLVLFGPYSFYCACLYTEALFMLLTMLFLYEMRKENFILMGTTGALLSATRVTGVMMVFAVLLYVIQRHVKEKRGDIKKFFTDILSDHKLVLGVCIVPLGLFAYMLYLRMHMGDALAFLRIQKAWGRSGVNVYNMLRSVFTAENYVEFHYWVVFLILIAVTVYQARKKPYETVPYVIPCAINFVSLGFMNLARYSWGSGIAIIGLIDAMDEHLSKAARIFVYIVLAITAVRLQYWWFISAPIAVG